MRYRERLRREVGDIDSEIRKTPVVALILISCLALILAATIAFGGLRI